MLNIIDNKRKEQINSLLNYVKVIFENLLRIACLLTYGNIELYFDVNFILLPGEKNNQDISEKHLWNNGYIIISYFTYRHIFTG